VGYGLQKDQDNLYLGIVLALVVTITGVFSYLQERKSSDLMNSFANMMPSLTTVVRDGQTSKINAVQLVRGDVVVLKGGDKVPADLRVVECSDDMKVDNSSLTGESEACKRQAMCTDPNPLETRNLCFFGTLIPAGTARCVVVNIGDQTVMGRIAALSLQTENVETPIARELEHFIKIVSGIAIFLGVLFFIIGAALGRDMIANLVFMIGIIVANVPEGLLATVTVCLTLTAQRMATKMVLVKNLEGVETLGSTSCICFDKTGTLTQNIMTVAHCVFDLQIWDAESSLAEQNFDSSSPTFKRLQQCATLCNTAVWDKRSQVEKDPLTGEMKAGGKDIPFSQDITLGDGSIEHRIMWSPIGDASESAMIKFCQPMRDILDFRAEYPKNDKGKIPFNSANKYQVQIIWDPKDGCWVNEFKGAPERVTARCTHIMLEGEYVPITEEHKKKIDDLQTQLSRRGMRCLGFAEKRMDIKDYPKDYVFDSDSVNFPIGEPKTSYDEKAAMAKTNKDVAPPAQMMEGLCYLGIMALIDPPRPQVPGAVALCKTAGIKVIMVTGDHPETAKAIAKKVGIIWGETCDDIKIFNEDNGLTEGKPGWRDPDVAPAIVVPGWDISVDTPKEVWDDILAHSQVVFARTSPQQKLIIVENCQQRKHVVAVTGDGVNDSPALKKADIGVAMGIMGTDVSKEAADMILLDDNFASIVSGVEEGRLIFDNLKKSIAYTLSSNIPEISPFLVNVVCEVPLPLSTVLILCVDLGTDMIPAISMAWEKAEADIMKRNPRDADNDRLVTTKLVSFAYLQIGVIQAFSGFFTWITVLSDYGYLPHTLMGLDALDMFNRGKHTMYCSTKGGAWRNFKGEECPCFDYANQHDSLITPTAPESGTSAAYSTHKMCANTAGQVWWENNPKGRQARAFVARQCQRIGYQFWDQDSTMQYNSKATGGLTDDETAEVEYCEYPMLALRGAALGDSPSNFNYFNPATYINSDGQTYNAATVFGQPTRTSIEALTLGANYAPYMPYRSVTSVFFNRKAGAWQTDKADDELTRVGGMGDDVDKDLFFKYQPIGTWNVYESSKDPPGKYWQVNVGNWPKVKDFSTDAGSDSSTPQGENVAGFYKTSEYFYSGGYLDMSLNLGQLRKNTITNEALINAYAAATVSKATPNGTVISPGCGAEDSSAPCSAQTPDQKKLAAADSQDLCRLAQSTCPNNVNFGCADINPLITTKGLWNNAVDATTTCYSGANGNTQLLNVWSRTFMKASLQHAQSASFIAIIVVQWADLVICKTRWLSIRQQGMSNDVMNFALVWELLLGAILCYIPGIPGALGTAPLRVTHWFPAIPFSIFILLYDETRKYLMRSTSISTTDKTTGRTMRDPGWLERNTYY